MHEASRMVADADSRGSLVLQGVVGVDNQNNFLFLCAPRLWALQSCLGQLDEDMVLKRRQNFFYWIDSFTLYYLKKKLADSRNAPACGWPSLSGPSYWSAPPLSRSLTRSPSDTSSPRRFSSAPPLPQLQHRLKMLKTTKKDKCKEENLENPGGVPSSTLRRWSTSRLEMRLYSENDRRRDGLDWLLGSAWPFISSTWPLTWPFIPSAWPFIPFGTLLP